jgi:ABC-2 type transport system permease protein
VGPFLAMVKKELASVTREKTIMIAIMIQLVIASFSSVMLVGLLSFYDPESIGLNARVRIKVGLTGDVDNAFVGFLEDHNVRVATFASSLDAERAFKAGAVDAFITIPDGSGVVDARLFLPESETRSTLILMILREPMERYENYLRDKQGVQVRYTDIGGMPSTTYEFRYSIIVPILMFLAAFVTGSMVVDSISEEFENHTLDTLWSAPLSLNTIFGAKIAAAMVLSAVQCTLWSMLLRLNRTYIARLGLVLLLAGIITAIIAVASAFISAYFKDRERSQFVYSLLIPISLGVSHLFDASPIALLTRLATGDYYTSAVDVGVYAILLVVLLVTFFSVTERLVAAHS